MYLIWTLISFTKIFGGEVKDTNFKSIDGIFEVIFMNTGKILGGLGSKPTKSYHELSCGMKSTFLIEIYGVI